MNISLVEKSRMLMDEKGVYEQYPTRIVRLNYYLFGFIWLRQYVKALHELVCARIIPHACYWLNKEMGEVAPSKKGKPLYDSIRWN